MRFEEVHVVSVSPGRAAGVSGWRRVRRCRDRCYIYCGCGGKYMGRRRVGWDDMSEPGGAGKSDLYGKWTGMGTGRYVVAGSRSNAITFFLHQFESSRC